MIGRLYIVACTRYSQTLSLHKFDISEYQTRIVSCILAESVYKMLNLPLKPVSSGTPAAAAGSHSLGPQRNAQPSPQSDTLPSHSW